MPKATVMRMEDVRVLDALIEQGANVIFVDEMPSVAFNASEQAELSDFSARRADLLAHSAVSAVKQVTTKVALTVDSEQIVYVSPYERNGVDFFFLANASDTVATLTLRHADAVAYRLYDPVSGEITEVDAREGCRIPAYRALFVEPLPAE